MSLYCPHCHTPYDGAASSDREAQCPACGGQWRFAGPASTAAHPGNEHSTLVAPPPATLATPALRNIGHFALLEHVGHGAFGDVWRARDTALDRDVAVKLPRRGDLSQTESDYFLREARAAAQLKHPNIVSVHEAGERDGTLFIVSDFIEGVSLKDRLAERRLTIRESVELTVKIADALHHAHEAGVVHRDLKPANIMIDTRGEPLVMDFGLAKRETGETTMTMEGNVLGTPAYMSPEQARGEGHAADRRADIYSLGVMLFEFLTGERPFRGDARMLIVQIANDPPPSPRKLESRLPRDLETICLKCLETVPSRRYQTAGDLADDLRRWLEGRPVVARPVGWVGRAWRTCARRPLLASLAGVSLTLALAVLIGGPILYLNERSAHDFAQEQKADAIAARNEAQQELAKQAFQSARLAGERGRWREALEHLAAAEAAGYPDALELGFLRARALRSVTEFEAWSKEISRLDSLPKIGPQRATFLLLKAEQLRFQGKRDEGLALAARALELGLPKAQAAYARGLLARTTPDAARHFQEAVEIDPTYHEASSSLVATLVLLGRLPQAALQARVAHHLFPKDPNYVFWLALMATLRRDTADAEYWTRRLSGQLEKENAAFVRQALKAVDATIGPMLRLQMPKGGENLQLLQAWMQFNRIQTAAQHDSRQNVEIAAMFRSLINSIPPAMSRAFEDFGKLDFVRLARIRLGQDARFNAALAKLSKVHPEATIFWLHGAMLTARKKYDKASDVLVRAAEAPAMIPAIQMQSMYLAAVARHVRFLDSKDPADIRRAAELAWRRVRMGDLSKDDADLLRIIALAAADLPLAREIVRNVLTQFPGDRHWLRWQMGIEFIAGRYFVVVELANRHLKENPNDRDVFQLRRNAAIRIRTIAARIPKRYPVIAPKPERRR